MSKIVVIMGVDGRQKAGDQVSRGKCSDVLVGQGHDVVVKSGRRTLAMLRREASKLDLVVVDFDNASMIDDLLTIPAYKGAIVAVTSLKRRRTEMEKAGATVTTMEKLGETVRTVLANKRPPQHRKVLACFGNRNRTRNALFAVLGKLRGFDLARLHRSEEIVMAVRQHPKHVALIVVDFMTFSYMRDRITRAGYQGKIVGVATESEHVRSMEAKGLVATSPDNLLATVQDLLRPER